MMHPRSWVVLLLLLLLGCRWRWDWCDLKQATQQQSNTLNVESIRSGKGLLVYVEVQGRSRCMWWGRAGGGGASLQAWFFKTRRRASRPPPPPHKTQCFVARSQPCITTPSATHKVACAHWRVGHMREHWQGCSLSCCLQTVHFCRWAVYWRQ